MSKPNKKAQKNYEKYLGKMVSKAVKKQIPSFNPPTYFKGNYCMRTVNTIVLYADEQYFKEFSNAPDNRNIWQHHLPIQYLSLAEKLK